MSDINAIRFSVVERPGGGYMLSDTNGVPVPYQKKVVVTTTVEASFAEVTLVVPLGSNSDA